MRAEIEVYFSPEVNLEKLVTGHIGKAKKSIHVAMYSFTHPDFSRALFKRFRCGVDCKVILDKFTANGVSEASELADYGIPVRINTGWGKMHHKFCVIDSRYVLMRICKLVERVRQPQCRGFPVHLEQTSSNGV